MPKAPIKSSRSAQGRDNAEFLKPMGGLKVKGVNFYRDAKKVRKLRMLDGGGPTRDSSGKIVKSAEFQGRLAPGTQMHVHAERSYWENTRTIKQDQLEVFREALRDHKNDPYSFILRSRHLPMSLLKTPTKSFRCNLLQIESFQDTFGPNAHRKRPNLSYSDINELAEQALESASKYESSEKALEKKARDELDCVDALGDPVALAGQSKRIWGELYKVIDSSDVVVQVLDARMPEETRCRKIEKYLKAEKPHKHLVIVLNKCDLLPNSISVSSLSASFY